MTINYVDATPSRVRTIVDLGFGGLTRGLDGLPKPVIAAVDGWVPAGGLEQAVACDLRVASERAMFGSFEARRAASTTGTGEFTRLVNTCGVGVVMQRVLTAQPIGVVLALQGNLVNEVVPAARWLDEALLLARQIQRNA